MRRELLKLFGVAVVSGIVSLSVLSLWHSKESAEDELYIGAGISHLDIEFKDKSILLNVQLSKPLSCKEVFSALGVEDIPLKSKVYSPACTSVTPSLVIITYKEKISL